MDFTDVDTNTHIVSGDKTLITYLYCVSSSYTLNYLEDYRNLICLSLSLESTDIDIIDKIPLSVEILDLYINDFTHLPNMSKYINIKKLSIDDYTDSLCSISNLPPNLKEFECKCTNLTNLDNVPPSVEILNCNGCISLTSLNNLPPNLIELDCSLCSKLTNLDNISPSVEKLNCNDCYNLTNLDNLSPHLKYLKCRDCHNLTSLNNLPPSIEELDCSYCSITSLIIPSSLRKLNYSNCKKLITIIDNHNRIGLIEMLYPNTTM